MPRQSKDTIAVLGIDIGKNTFHLIGLSKLGSLFCARSYRVANSKL
jgi:hypothetical protein